MKKVVSVDVISSCVCRDSFELGDKLTKKYNYSVAFFYQATSPISLYSKPIKELQALDEGQLIFGSPWQRRILLCDINKDMFERIGKEKRKNYLILDFTDFAKNLYKLSSDQPSYLIQTEPSKNNKELFSQIVEDVVKPWELPNEYVFSCLDRYVSDLLKIYDAEQIILCEVYHVKEYVAQDKSIKQFASPIEEINSFIKVCYEYVENKISQEQKGLHIIKMPNCVLGDEMHKWGKYTLHFCKEFYEYLFSAIDTVCSGYEVEEEAEILEFLKIKCQSQFEKIRSDVKLFAKLKEKEAKETDLISRLEKSKAESAQLRVEIEHLESKNRQLTLEKEALSVEITEIRESKSYKIGRGITYLPRKLRKSKGQDK